MILGMMSYDAVDASRVPDEFDISNVPSYTASISAGHYGNQAFSIKQIIGSNYFAGGFLNTSNSSTVIQGTDVMFSGTGIVAGPIMALMDGAITSANLSPGAFPGIQIVAVINSNGSISFYRGSNLTIPTSGTLLGTTSTGIIQLGVWQQIEWVVFINASTGSILCKVNGTTVANLTGLNTKPGTNNYPTSLVFLSFNGSGSINQVFDNSYVLDNSGSSYNNIIGPQGMDVHMPNGTGHFSGWSALASPNWSQVDDYANASILSASPVPDDSASYIYSPASGSNINDTYPVNLFAQRSLSAIQFTFRAKSTVASGNRVIKAAIYDGTSIFAGPGILLNVADTNWHSYRDISFATTDPSTSGTWNTTLLNSRQYGIINYGNSLGGGDTAVAQVSQIKVTRMFPAYSSFVPNHPLWITG